MKAKLIHQAFERDARSILRVVRKKFPEARIASGCPADVRGFSDVDILVFREGADEKRVQRRIERREVNILITGNPQRKRSLDHRLVELVMARSRPQALREVAALKSEGMKTEAAWAKALSLHEGDPYDAVAEIAQEWRQQRADGLQLVTAAIINHCG
jgi:hypothetical protein